MDFGPGIKSSIQYSPRKKSWTTLTITSLVLTFLLGALAGALLILGIFSGKLI